MKLIKVARYKGYTIMVKESSFENLGNYKCGYVDYSGHKELIAYFKNNPDAEENIKIHGGATYHNENIIGWDYAHYNDIQNSLEPKFKPIEIMKVVNDAKEVIEQLILIENKEV